MKSLRKFLALPTLLGSILLISGCQEFSATTCPYSTDQFQPANSGCLITKGDEVMIVTMRRTGKQSLPGGTSEEGETARCTAYRETMEETGIQVTVHDMLAQFSNGFQLYRCEVVSEITAPASPQEISDVSWRSWLSLRTENWRYPSLFHETRQLIREQITGISREME